MACLVRLEEFSRIRIELPRTVGSNLGWSNGFNAVPTRNSRPWLTSTQRRLISELLKVPDVLCVIPYNSSVQVEFITDAHAKQQMQACMSAVAKVLREPEDVWTIAPTTELEDILLAVDRLSPDSLRTLASAVRSRLHW